MLGIPYMLGVPCMREDHTHVTSSLRSPSALRALEGEDEKENRNGHFGEGIERLYEPKWTFRVTETRKRASAASEASASLSLLK